jgi:ubiquitin C-terminal hydrolase
MKESLVGINQFDCNEWNTKTDADTWLNIEQSNDILIIQLNRFATEGTRTKKRNEIIEMPLQFVLNNKQYELIAFVVHDSPVAAQGHYITYANYNGIWKAFNDDAITTSVDASTIDNMKDRAYYYCYHAAIKDYAAYVELAAQTNIVEKECAFCH